MTTTDSVFQRALSHMLTEIFDGPPGQELFPATIALRGGQDLDGFKAGGLG
jgi:hypothetical protein